MGLSNYMLYYTQMFCRWKSSWTFVCVNGICTIIITGNLIIIVHSLINQWQTLQVFELLCSINYLTKTILSSSILFLYATKRMENKAFSGNCESRTNQVLRHSWYNYKRSLGIPFLCRIRTKNNPCGILCRKIRASTKKNVTSISTISIVTFILFALHLANLFGVFADGPLDIIGIPATMLTSLIKFFAVSWHYLNTICWFQYSHH